VTQAVDHGGLGFGFKWNMGWMNDSLRYYGREPLYRQYHHNEMTFALAYAYSENFVLPISHDEVVHGKGSMFERAPEDEWRKFATMRAFYTFMWCHPGKQLLFMGTEFGQRREFSEERSLDWDTTNDWGHRGVQRLVKDLNAAYKAHPALWKLDTDPSGFSWIDADDRGGNVFSFLRYDGEGQMLAALVNFSGEPRPDYRIGLPAAGVWKEVFNSDAEVYDGSGKFGNLGQVVAKPIPSHGYPASAAVTIPPLGGVWLVLQPTPDEEQAEPEKVAAGSRAAAKRATPGRTATDGTSTRSAKRAAAPKARPATKAAAAVAESSTAKAKKAASKVPAAVEEVVSDAAAKIEETVEEARARVAPVVKKATETAKQATGKKGAKKSGTDPGD
jgi:1,4-alpha-glucan branching enzyme